VHKVFVLDDGNTGSAVAGACISDGGAAVSRLDSGYGIGACGRVTRTSGSGS